MNGFNNFEDEYDSLRDVAEYQKNMYNPGYYVGTGKVPPTVSAPGNATPLVVICFFAAALFLAFGLFLFLSDDVIIVIGFVESAIARRIIALIVMIGISAFFSLLGFAYLKKVKRYYRNKADWDSEEMDESVEDQLLQRTCPKCGYSHDIDYPKCPNCKFNYYEQILRMV